MDTVFVKEVRPYGPAHFAGLQNGDRLLTVNGMPVAGTPYNRVVAAIQQAPATLTLHVVPKECDILQTVRFSLNTSLYFVDFCFVLVFQRNSAQPGDQSKAQGWRSLCRRTATTSAPTIPAATTTIPTAATAAVPTQTDWKTPAAKGSAVFSWS